MVLAHTAKDVSGMPILPDPNTAIHRRSGEPHPLQIKIILIERTSRPHPCWAGGGVLIEPGVDRRVIGLLDDLVEDLRH